MGAGELRDLITVVRQSKASNNRGGSTLVETTIVENLPAKIVVRKGGEQLQADRLSGVTPVDITVRLDADSEAITSADSATDQDGHRYSIKWVGSLDEGRNRWLTIMAERGTLS